MEVSNGEDNSDGSSSDSSEDNDDPTPSRPVQIMDVDYTNDIENDTDFEREDKEGDEEGDEEEDEEEEGDEENVEIDEDGEEDEEEVIIIEDDDDDVQIVEPKFAGKYTDLPPLPKPDWNKEPPHWKYDWNSALQDEWAIQSASWLSEKRLSVMAESVRKWQKWQNDISKYPPL